MGKKKQSTGKDTGRTPAGTKEGEKGKKTYSLSQAKSGNADVAFPEDLQKVSIPPELEKRILDVITKTFNDRQIDKEVSGRLTNKKLMDMYSSLNSAGFSHKQIEQAMDSTVLHGGDLIDALDWLCLNLPDEELPSNFSEALQKEEAKVKPRARFDTSYHDTLSHESKKLKQKNKDQEETKKPKPQKMSMKEQILWYAENESDSENSQEETDDSDDPNERYLELTALLLDAKELATQAKMSGNKTEQKTASKKIREYMLELSALENHPDFNPAVKIDILEHHSTQGQPQTAENQSDIKASETSATSLQGDDGKEEEEEDMGLSFFQDDPSPPVSKAAETTKSVTVHNVRRFEYTRQQWTGKSPKQFLMDWCRKHLPKSSPPKFEKQTPRANKFRFIVKIDRRKDGMLEVCPEILCENVKEAEHLAATLALYHLCKGQSVHQLLPPPYRDVWLEWQAAENQQQHEEKIEENKPRDQYLSQLLKRLQLNDKDSLKSVDIAGEDAVESWETLEDDEPQECNSSTASLHKKKHPVESSSAVSDIYLKNCESEKFKSLLNSREQLPVCQYEGAVVEQLKTHNVILIAGETGCGKSTQIPHFILKDCLLNASPVGQNCNIVCTEPRRISAISLARRVSEEMGEKEIGSRDSLCGYQIRFESKRGPATRLTYCTTGVILRQLQLDPGLKDVSHIIVDEVHERSVQSDFLLIILKRLLTTRQDLKVILMSATIDVDRFSTYFQRCPVINIPGRTFPVQVYHIEDVIEETHYVVDDDSPYVLRQGQLIQEEETSVQVTEKGGHQSKVDLVWTKDNIGTIDYTSLSSEKYSQKTRNTLTRLNLQRINMDLIVDLLVHLETDDNYKEVKGAVLIFLPGLADITELFEILQSDKRFNDSRHRIIALHSILSSGDQQSVFNIPPKGVRKIVLATNIAETGITIPDVVFVIDAGKVKENRYKESSEMNVLEEVFISKANAKQRQGRAGRVREGYCFRLYTKKMYDGMRDFSIPELLRVPLEELCLNILKCEYGNPEEILSTSLDPPQPQTVSRAMTLLHSVGACREGKLTPLGHHLAALPVHVRIGKMLLYGAVFDCLEPVAVIAAAMTDKSPFVAVVGKQDLVNQAKQALAVANSDQITVYKAYLCWEESRSKGRQAEAAYCKKNFLNRKTLMEIQNVKSDLKKLIHSIGFSTSESKQESRVHVPVVPNSVGKGDVLEISKHIEANKLDNSTVSRIKAVILAGLYPNIAKVKVDTAVNVDSVACVGETTQGQVHVHPSSVNRCLQTNGWLVFHQKVKSSRVYIRDCCLVSPYDLLLFGGDIEVKHSEKLVTVNENVKYGAYAKTGVMFKELRKLLDSVLARKLDNPQLDIASNPVVRIIEELLVVETK